MALECPSISMINQHVTCPDTLVIFDLDNTVIDSAIDRWFGSMIGHAKGLGYDDLAAVNAVLPHYFEKLSQAKMSPAEESTISVIQSLQARGIPVIGLTTRSSSLSECTQQQLQSIGVDLSKTSITPYHITFALKEPAAALRHGIMFCGNNDKGESLKALFNATGYKPKKRIVFVDYKEKYVKSVMKAAADLNVECIGIRYSCLDSKLNEFVLDEQSKQLLRPVASKMIVEQGSIEDLDQYVTENTLVLFDIDETIMRMEHAHQFGSSRWLSKLIGYAMAEHNFTQADVEKVILPHYYAAQEVEPVVPVEDATVRVIHALQARNVPVMGLTARRLEVMEATLRKIRNLGIDFSVTAPIKETMSFAINHPNLFINGIQFCGGVTRNQPGEKPLHAKDMAIKALLNHLPERPKHIVVMDDNPHYLASIVDAVASLGIDCVGIRYSACDEHAKNIVLDEPSKQMICAYAAQKA
jgi:FMN phosphatase YigB (HAD superfamily)